MLHIIQNKNKTFEVVSVGENGELLSATHQQFERKAGCYKNIRAQLGSYNSLTTIFQDDTLKKPKAYIIRMDCIDVLPLEPHPVYTPSRKKKLKK